jgi:hypothetical protein
VQAWSGGCQHSRVDAADPGGLLGCGTPGSWTQSGRPRAGDVTPFSLDGTFTLGGTWLGMLGGFVILSEKKGRFLAGEGGWRRLVRFLIGLVGVAILYFGLGQLFPREREFPQFCLAVCALYPGGLWISWVGPWYLQKLACLIL